MEPQNQMNQFSQMNQAPSNAPVQNQAPKQKNKSLPVIIILAILVVAGLGFGIYEFWQNLQNKEEIANLEAENAMAEQDAFETVSTGEEFSAQTIQQLLEDKYEVKATGNVNFENYFYNGLDDFNLLVKEKIVASELYFRKYPDCQTVDTYMVCQISYDDFLQEYQSLFGDFDEIKRENIIFSTNEPAILPKVIYNNSTDSFEIYNLSGIGGTTSEQIIYKVANATKVGDTVNAEVMVTVVNIDPAYIEESPQNTYDDLKLYNFKFREYDGGYVLSEITNITK